MADESSCDQNSEDRDEPRHDQASTVLTLEQIRQRLLDLSRRNTLLNYRHPPKRSIRVIDEMPDQLFRGLLAERKFFFEPLPRVPRIEEQMPAEVRTFLEELRDPRRPPPREWAKLHDIEPNFELPTPGSDKHRHQDYSIQSILYPVELETRLRSMAQLARTAIEESGANILYLAFGFLEWRESEDSDQVSLAPLVLVPVSLKKSRGLNRETRRERFTL